MNQITYLEKKLREARKTLTELKRVYGDKSEFYQDQLDYIAALREALEARSSKHKRNPTPDEWDEISDEGARLGSLQARALGRTERERRASARYFNVTWYSKQRGKRTGFIRPIEAVSATDAKQQARAMVTNEKPVNIVAKEVTSNPANERLMACSVAQLQRELKYHNAKSPAAVAIRNMLREKKKQQKNPGLIAFAEGVQAADYLGKKFKIRNPERTHRYYVKPGPGNSRGRGGGYEVRRIVLIDGKEKDAGLVETYSKRIDAVRERTRLNTDLELMNENEQRDRLRGYQGKNPGKAVADYLEEKEIRSLAQNLSNLGHTTKQIVDFLSVKFDLTTAEIKRIIAAKNPGFFTTTRQRKPKAGSEDYLGRAANPKNKANDDWWIARVREVFPAVTDEMPSKRFAESYSYLLERMETPQAKRIMRKMYGVKYANLQFRTSFNPNDSSVRSPTRTSTEVKSPTKTSTSTWAKTTGNITVTGGAGAGATTRVTVRRNPGEYEQSVKIIESAIRKAVARAKRQGTIGMSAANLKQLLSTIDLRGVNLAGPGAFNRAFDEALARFTKTSKFRIINPSVIALAETFQGRASGAVKEFKAAGSAPSDLARIGKLVFLKLADSRRQIAAPGAMVAVDTKGKLWIVSQRAPMFTQKAAPGEALDFGEIERICYLTAKQHIESGKLTEYVHTFGEDGGKRPHLLVDHEGMPILRGGEYQIRAEGIVN